MTAPAEGELYTVVPHRMPDGSKTGLLCGRWHCRVKGDGFDASDGTRRITVQEMKVDGGRWKPAIHTAVPIAALVPLEVQLDLFGNPAGGAR